MLIKRTKIVCTMGPACDDDDTLREMMKAGMNVARFNFSHGSYEEHHVRMERVKRISRELGTPVGILLDTKGPEIRTGLLEGHAKVELPTGAEVTVTAAETSEERLGTAEHFYLDHLELPREVHVGGTILIDDGLIGLTVTSIDGQDIHCTVQNGGSLGERKGVNVPNAKLSLPTMTERDREDILFGLKEGIDFIAASFIRDAEGVREIRKLRSASSATRTAASTLPSCPRSSAPPPSTSSTTSSRLPTASWSPAATWASRSLLRSARRCRRRSSTSATWPTSRSSPPRRCSTP